MKKLTGLIILDGFGIGKKDGGNAILSANTPNIDALVAKYPNTAIEASGMAVGLPEGQMGNSEVGHMNIGAGRIVYQELTRITKSINDGDFYENAVLVEAIESAKAKGTAVHLFGLCSDGGVHSHLTHGIAVLKLCKKLGVSDVYVHCFMDGRDVAPTSGKGYVEQLQAAMEEIGVGKVATVIGRYYAMDRDNRWERVQVAYNAIVKGEGDQYGADAPAMIQKSYDDGVTDEFIKPIVVDGGATIKKDDSIIFYNFRPDRAREITRTFIMEDFDGFERQYFPVHYVCFTQYDASFGDKVNIAFKPQSLDNTLGAYLASQGKTQLRIAETEKYAHVTFFFNGGVEAPNAGEDRELIPSPKVDTYDLKPEMSAYEVADRAVELINEGKYDFMVLNFANPDMVGHTGVIPAAVAAVEAVDACVGKVTKAILDNGGSFLLTADHGNAETMIDENGGPMTAHSTNPVMLLLAGYDEGVALNEGGKLCDIAPTLLEMMGIAQPAEMTGVSLLKK
ncbi:MAG: 2,3-bisphosphoglycerate-independent phosphoglycerate mutase [Clostridiales bacterium]|nr:2,3-bisphosphoglycerate-independent phosphoglycerate mutase [Clostridiales bacterium]